MLSEKTSTDTKVEWNNGDKIETITTVLVQEFANNVKTTTTVKKITHKSGGGTSTSTSRSSSTKGKGRLVSLFRPEVEWRAHNANKAAILHGTHFHYIYYFVGFIAARSIA